MADRKIYLNGNAETASDRRHGAHVFAGLCCVDKEIRNGRQHN